MQKELAIPAGIFSLDLELEFRITVAARRIDRTHGSDLELCDGICREHQFQIADMLAVNTQQLSFNCYHYGYKHARKKRKIRKRKLITHSTCI